MEYRKNDIVTLEIVDCGTDGEVANPPIRIEILPPYQIMEKISLPMVSVPKRNSAFGALL